jgi:hypothetical protein
MGSVRGASTSSDPTVDLQTVRGLLIRRGFSEQLVHHPVRCSWVSPRVESVSDFHDPPWAQPDTGSSKAFGHRHHVGYLESDVFDPRCSSVEGGCSGLRLEVVDQFDVNVAAAIPRCTSMTLNHVDFAQERQAEHLADEVLCFFEVVHDDTNVVQSLDGPIYFARERFRSHRVPQNTVSAGQVVSRSILAGSSGQRSSPRRAQGPRR